MILNGTISPRGNFEDSKIIYGTKGTYSKF